MTGGPFRNHVEAENAHQKVVIEELRAENARLSAELAKRDAKPPKSKLLATVSAAIAFVGALCAWVGAHAALGPFDLRGPGVRVTYRTSQVAIDRKRERANTRLARVRKRWERVRAELWWS